MLALTNLASALQEIHEYHGARPLLERALAQESRGNQHYAIALDLYGSNVGTIDQDFVQEAELHRKAMRIEPGRALFRANLIMALLCGGEIKKARQEWQAGKHLLPTVPNFELLEMLMQAYSSDDPVPESYIEIAQHLQEVIGPKAIVPLIEKAWRWRRSAEPENAFGVRVEIGILAGRAGRSELALEAWREIKTLPGEGRRTRSMRRSSCRIWAVTPKHLR
jgi:tetratricopeptide (TPR) repeat protein